MFCYPSEPSDFIVLAADWQSLIIGGGFAYYCDDGCLVTKIDSGKYTLTTKDGSSNTFGNGAFMITDAGSTLTWANNVVFTKDACPEEGIFSSFLKNKFMFFELIRHFSTS